MKRIFFLIAISLYCKSSLVIDLPSQSQVFNPGGSAIHLLCNHYSPVIGVIPFKEKILIQDIGSKELYFGGEFYWLIVEYQGKRGCVFSEGIPLYLGNSTFLAEYYYNKGMKYLAEKKYYKALYSFDNAVDVNPFYLEPYYFRAKSYKELNFYSGCILNYTKALSDGKETFITLFNRSVCYYKLGFLNSAKKDLMLIKRYDQQLDGKFNRLTCKVLYFLRDDEAYSYCKNALKEFPTDRIINRIKELSNNWSIVPSKVSEKYGENRASIKINERDSRIEIDSKEKNDDE